MLALTLRVVRGMTVHADRMLANLEITSGALFSQRVLLALVASGHAARRRVPDRPAARPAGLGHADAAAHAARARRTWTIDLDEVFDYGYYMRHVPEVLARLEVIPSPS